MARLGARSERPALYRYRALGTRVELVVTDSGVLVHAASLLRARVERLDRLASRFRSDSEISLLNDASGSTVSVSPELLELLQVSLSVAEATGGAVDPTVGSALAGLGYDRDFALVAPGVDCRLPLACSVPGWQSVRLDARARTLRAPPGTVIDLGATAKAWAADQIAREVADALRCGVLVSLGGDIAVGGRAPAGGFVVGVTDVCTQPETQESIAISSGGVATSGTAARQWRLGGHRVHHIVDPGTGLSSASPWRTVSVAAASCLGANAAATAAVVKGLGAPGWLTELSLPARLVGADGVVRRTPGWPAADPAHVCAGSVAR